MSTRHFATTRDALLHLRKANPGMAILAMETTGRSKTYSEVDYRRYYYRRSDDHDGEEETTDRNDRNSTGGIALILGNEVTGVDTDLFGSYDSDDAPLVDDVVELPTYGRKNSLNVAACAPVVIYEVLRQWNASAP